MAFENAFGKMFMIHMLVFPKIYVKEHQRKHTVPQMTYVTSSAN